MLLLKIDRKSKIPIYKQILNQLIQLIEKDVLKPGDRLPATRKLAENHELNRNTVYRAYQELWALGYIESTTGSYSVIRERKNTANVNRSDDTAPTLTNWNHFINAGSSILIRPNIKKVNYHHEVIDFIPMSPDPVFSPVNDIRKCFNEALKYPENMLLNYGDESGYPPLKRIVTEHLQNHAIQIKNSEIVITNGAQHALELIIKLLIKPGREVIVESPTYSAVIPLLNYYQAKIIEIPVNDQGIDLKILEKRLKTSSPAFLYTMPNFQNPTGITTNQEHREKLMEICEKQRLPVIEDGFVEEMKYFGRNFLPLKSLDTKGLVFYVGTFSKVLFPGLRIGWIASNEYFSDRFSEQIKASLISVNHLSQAALEIYCTKGLYEKQLRKIHRVYRKRMTLALKILRENLKNSHVKYTKPLGGYLIWFEIENTSVSEDELINTLIQNGVNVSCGKEYYSSKNNRINFRISIAHRSENEIEKGLTIITQQLNKL